MSIAILVAAALLVVNAGAPRADVAFRKKPVPAATPAPTGGDLPGAPAADSTAPPAPTKLQAADPDGPRAEKPKEPVLVAQPPPAEPPGPPIYKKWKFWAITGGVVVGVVALAFGGAAVRHAMNGGDVKSCDPKYLGCFGQGR